MLKILFVSSTSVCCELQNDSAYYTDRYTVLLDGKSAGEFDVNVFSLFGLQPDTAYIVGIEGEAQCVQFVTRKETCCVSVKSFGAVGDGTTDDSAAVQNAINCLPKRGRLYFPEGRYYVAPITLKSDITLEFAEGATLLGSTDESRYPLLPGEVDDIVSGKQLLCGTWEGNASPMPQALVFGAHIANVNIIGRGVIDGNAQNGTWWQNVKTRPVPRPRLVFLNDCSNITFHGVSAQNAASWQFHPFFSKNINFYDIAVSAPKNSPNTDGLDPESCDNVNIVGCRFSVGDDCIAIKAGKIYLGQKYKRPANRHTVRNCLMQFGHGAVTLGSELSGGVKNLTVTQCVFNATDRGLRIKTRRGRGKNAVVDGVTFANIVMTNVLTPIVINAWYNCCDPDRFSEYVWSRQHLPVDARTPYLGKFVFKNMSCQDCHVAAAYCDGLPERPIKEIVMENIVFTFAQNAHCGKPAMRSFMHDMSKAGAYFDNVEKLTVSNVSFDGVTGDELIVNNVRSVERK
ncbi:MAG: glycoside hydrolase family 28 protein [Corallococcus sp.]|nr:glycoside hydrolase family 28 protein [Corallococcus sp.]